MIEEFENNGCQVEFVGRPISSDPNDQILLQIRGAVAEYEWPLLAERMRRTRLAKFKWDSCCHRRTFPTVTRSIPTDLEILPG